MSQHRVFREEPLQSKLMKGPILLLLIAGMLSAVLLPVELRYGLAGEIPASSRK